MIEAKDTVIKMKWMSIAVAKDQNALLLKQALTTWDIAFKAGIGEVVEWLKDSRANGDFVLDFESDWWLNRLKEWGIDGKL